MGANSAIEWTDHTFNPWVGCTKLSPACDHCYAEGWAKRTGNAKLWQGERRRTTEANWRQPIKWNAAAEKAGCKARVFCCSLADVFDNQVPPEWRADLFALIRATPHLEWQLLTKRPQNIVKMRAAAGGLPWNAALGTTAENQEQADIRIPALLEAKRFCNPLYAFVSIEPLLGPIDLTRIEIERAYGSFLFDALSGRGCTHVGDPFPTERDGVRLDWVIVGGESGPGARPMHPQWARDLRDQCKAAGVPFFFKQHGEYLVMPTDRERSKEHIFLSRDWDFVRVGKKAAGRLLDNQTHDAMPGRG